MAAWFNASLVFRLLRRVYPHPQARLWYHPNPQTKVASQHPPTFAAGNTYPRNAVKTRRWVARGSRVVLHIVAAHTPQRADDVRWREMYSTTRPLR